MNAYCTHANDMVRKLSLMGCDIGHTSWYKWYSRQWRGWFSINVLSHWHEAAWVMLRYWMQHAHIWDLSKLRRQSAEQHGLAIIWSKSSASTLESTFAAGCGVQRSTGSVMRWVNVASRPVSSPHSSMMRDKGISSTGAGTRSQSSSELLPELVSMTSYPCLKKGL